MALYLGASMSRVCSHRAHQKGSLDLSSVALTEESLNRRTEVQALRSVRKLAEDPLPSYPLLRRTRLLEAVTAMTAMHN
jgi:hypothetical protein